MLLVAGKGHEEGQMIGKTVIPFSDHEAVAGGHRRARSIMAEPALWTLEELVAATGGKIDGDVTQVLERCFDRQPHRGAGRYLRRHQGRDA